MRQQTVHGNAGILVKQVHFIGGITLGNYHDVYALLRCSALMQILPFGGILAYAADQYILGVDGMAHGSHDLVVVVGQFNLDYGF